MNAKAINLIQQLDTASDFSAVFGSAFTSKHKVSSDIDLCFFMKNENAIQQVLSLCQQNGTIVDQLSVNGYSKIPDYKGTGQLHICIFDNEPDFLDFVHFDKKKVIEVFDQEMEKNFPLSRRLQPTVSNKNC